jgi:DNA repair protein RecO (recombination protein O)
MLKRTEGIVLSTSTFGEADLIATYLTADYGLIRVFAKSPRKTKSRFGSSLEPLTHATISFIGKEDASLPRLTQADILRSFHSLRENLPCFLRISELLELNLRFLAERDPSTRAFGLLIETLSRIEAHGDSPLSRLMYKIQFLETVGFAPRLDTCARCSRTATWKGVHKFYSAHGSLLCGDCISGEKDYIPLSDAALRFYKSFSRLPSEALERVLVPEQLTGEVNAVLSAHIHSILGRPLKSDAIAEAFKVSR